MIYNNTKVKKCCRCLVEYPATSEYFGFDKRNKDGFEGCCRICKRKANLEWIKNNSEKAKQNNSNWQKNNPDKVRKIQHNYYAQNREERLENSRRWREENPEKQAELCRNWQRNHRDYLNEYNKKYVDTRPEFKEKRKINSRNWRKKNPERHKDNNRKWRSANKERISANNENYRAVKRNANGKYSAADIQKQFQIQKHHCYYCDKPIRRKYHVDHVIPLIRGGSNSADNLVCACPRCNLSKGSKTLREWIEIIEDTTLYMRVAQRIVEREAM